MSKPEHDKILTVPKTAKVEFVNRPYPRAKPGSLLAKTEIDLVRHDGVLYIQENLRNPNRLLRVDPYGGIAEKNLKIMGTIDSRRIDRPGIIRTVRNKEVQRMWDVVATHEFPMTEAEEAFKISASQRCGKILLYPHGLPNAQEGG